MSQTREETEQEEKVTTQKEEPETKEKEQEDEDTSGNLNVLSNLTDEDKVLIHEEPSGGIENGNSDNMPDDDKGKNDEASESVIKNANIDDDINQESNIQTHDNADDNIGHNNPEVIDKIENDEEQLLQEKAKEEYVADDTTNENEENQETHAFIAEQEKKVSIDEGAASPVKSEEEEQEKNVDDENSDLSHDVKSNDQKEKEDDKSLKLETDATDDQSERLPTSKDGQKDGSDKQVSSVGNDEVEKKKNDADDTIIHTGHYDDAKYGTKDDGFEEGTMEIDDEVIQHEERERKYSSASSDSRSSKRSSKSSHTSKDERLNNSSSDMKENDREKDPLSMDAETDKNTEKDDSKNSEQHANVIQESQKTEQPEVKTQAHVTDSKKTEKKPQNVRYMDKGKYNKNDKVSTSSSVSPSRESEASNKHAYRKTSKSANFRRPEHTSPRGRTELVPRRRPRTTDTRTMPSRGTDKQKKNYFHEELRRLKTNLDTKAKSERRPEEREYYPYTFTTMGPYCDTHTAQFLICMSDDKSHGYVSRNTAIGLCDPWVDLRMDKEILPRLVPSKAQLKEKRVAEQKKKQKEKEKKATEGSTRLPKFPVVPFNTQKENATKMFPYSDVKKFRQEYCEKYSTSSQKRMDADYKKTRDDFYRMDLDRLHEIQPNNRKHMRKTYFAYLQNTPGSRKAVTQCVKELYNTTESEENKQQSPAPPTPQHTAQEVN